MRFAGRQCTVGSVRCWVVVFRGRGERREEGREGGKEGRREGGGEGGRERGTYQGGETDAEKVEAGEGHHVHREL